MADFDDTWQIDEMHPGDGRPSRAPRAEGACGGLQTYLAATSGLLDQQELLISPMDGVT